MDKPGARINLSSYEVLHDGKSLMGSLFGGLKPKSHVPILLKRYMDKVKYAIDFIFIFNYAVCPINNDIYIYI